MKKKIFGFVLLGAFTMFALSAITSCKKYDDDVDNLQSQISANQLAFEQAKSALESTVTGLQSQLEAARSDVSGNKALIAGLEARLATAEAALNSLKDIPETLAALGVKVDGVKTTVDGLSSTVTTEVNERKAADIAIQTQIDALKRLAEDGDAALKAQIDDIIEQLKQIDVNKGDIATLKTKLQEASDTVAQFDGRINTLEDLLGSSVRSLVFVPEFYYYGIEAAKLETMNYKYYTIKDVDADKDGEFNLTIITGEKVSCNPSTDATHLRYKSASDFNVMNFAAEYHVNPSSAKFDGATYKLLTGDKDYTRSSELADAGLYIVKKDADGKDVSPAKKVENDNHLVVNLGVRNHNAVKQIAASGNSEVTVFATEVTLPTAKGDGTYTVTSDYAAVRLVQEYGGYRLSNVCKAVGHENLDAAPAERKTMTGVLNNNACGAGAGLHMFSTFEECAYPAGDYPTGGHAQPAEDMYTDKKQDAQAYVMWNEELDLLRLVETRYASNDKPVEVSYMNANGLSYKFEIVGSFYGENKTSEGAHAIIKDGHIFRPQMPTEAGKQNKSIGTQAVTTVGRQPVVRVQLVYKKYNPETEQKTEQVVDYGYIRIKIVDKPVEPKADEFIEFTDDTYAETIYHGCVNPNYKDNKWFNTWDAVEYRLLHEKLNISKEVFDAHYEPVKMDDTAQKDPLQRGGLAQYTKKDNGQFVLADKVMGTFGETHEQGSAETSILEWDINGSEMKDNYNASAGTYTLSRAIKYQSNDERNYPSVYVLVNIPITIKDNGLSSGVFDLDKNKLKNYWFKHDVKEEGMDEARINVPSPEDGKTTVASPLESVLASQFTGNKFDAKNMLTVDDRTYYKDFDYSKLNYDLVFDASNNGKEFAGQTGTVYVLSVDANGKELKANIKNQSEKQIVAKLEIAEPDKPESVNNIKLAYQHQEYAEDLLNAKKYDNLEGMLSVVIAIKVWIPCENRDDKKIELPVTGNTFNERFVRPLNVEAVGETITDAKDKPQEIPLKNLVNLSDWRGYYFANHAGYWKYYNIKSITVKGGVPGLSINSVITTNMSGGTLGSTKLIEKSDLVEFKYEPITPSVIADDADYGKIVYTNNGNNVQDFTVRVPVRVTYEWGHIDTDVDILVKGTQGAK